jgi:RecA/RadA recombinase
MTDEKKELGIEDELDSISEDLVEETSQPSKTEVEEIVKSVELKKRGPKKKDLPTPNEEKTLTEKEAVETLDSKTKDLFHEFNAFIENKADVIQDTGIKETVPTGIDVLDAFMGGGFAVGTLGVVVGQPGSGKSMIAIQAIGAAQRKFKGNCLAAYLDSEEATTTIRMANLGVRFPKLKPYTDMTVEKVFRFIEGLCLFKEEKKIIDTPSVVVWDSIANTLSQKEREIEDINQAIGYRGRMLSVLIPKYVAKLSMYNICLVAVNQLRDVIQIGPFAAAKDMKFMTTGKEMPGGNALKFNAFHLMEMKVKSVANKEKIGFDGFISEIKFVKNKLFPPNIKFDIVGDFVTGFNNFWTNYMFLVECGRIQTGAWNTLVVYPSKKFRTVQALEMYNSEPEFKAAFDSEVKESIQKEIIDKYNPKID